MIWADLHSTVFKISNSEKNRQTDSTFLLLIKDLGISSSDTSINILNYLYVACQGKVYDVMLIWPCVAPRTAIHSVCSSTTLTLTASVIGGPEVRFVSLL